jgi:hypothetical protein
VPPARLLPVQVLAETTGSITLAGGRLMEAIPCSARSSRGRANGVVILDEAAQFVDFALAMHRYRRC